jgi:ADP-ribose pyrophosphatase YjhB (NUDIX family)
MWLDVIKRIEQAALGPIYGLVMWLRSGMWRIWRPMLMGVRVLIVCDGTVLLIRHRHGRQPWALPGGGIERYERMDEAARREAREETGAIVRVERLLGMYERFGEGISNYVAVFICAPLSEPDPPRSLEIAEARFFPLDCLPDGADSGTRRRIAEYLAGEHGITRIW